MVEVDYYDSSGEGLPAEDIKRVCRHTLARAGIEDGHLAVQIVNEEQIGKLNREHMGVEGPTDVLSFPVDGCGDTEGPREIGDVVICPSQAQDQREALVHGLLHLAGMDHERDSGEMLALQEEIVREL